ncbi:hypothetical protein KAU33_14455 [Candidatus Dependentiae bacterium]|nr:hypothetical protein [Candidatus Dependentiae bacterium]
MSEKNKNINPEFEESIEALKKRKEHVQQRIESLKFKLFWLTFAIIICGLVGYSLASFSNIRSNNFILLSTGNRLSYIIISALVGTFMYGYVITLFRFSSQGTLRRTEYKLVQLEAKEVQEKIEESFFSQLIKINLKYLDQYYLQTQEQSDKSFRLASSASIIGLVIIATGIIMMFLEMVKPAYVTTATGVISEFIAAVFFYLYNRTVLKMSQYHQKLVITQNISLALKISEDMDSDKKAKVQEMIVDRLTSDINKYLSISDINKHLSIED